MGQGIDLARDQAPLHAAALDNFKDQLLLVLIQRLGGVVDIPVAEVDATGRVLLLMSIDKGSFHFEIRNKQ